MDATLLMTAAGAVGGWVTKMSSLRAQRDHERELLQAGADAARAKAVDKARVYQGSYAGAVRAFLAVTVVLAVVVWPLVAGPLLGAHVTLGWTEFRPGWLFLPDHTSLIWHTVQTTGVVLTPTATTTMSAVVGFYLGRM